MSSGIINTIRDIKNSYRCIGDLATRYPSFFRPEKEDVNHAFRYFRGAEQAFLGLALAYGSYNVLKEIPLNKPAVVLGLALSTVTYVVVSLFKKYLLGDGQVKRSEKPFTGFVTKLYVDGVCALKKEVQILESVTWASAVFAVLYAGSRISMRHPVLLCTVTTIGTSLFVGHVALDLFHRAMKSI